MSKEVAVQNNNAAAPVPSMSPSNMGEAMQLANMMATAKLVPPALQKSPADCLLVIEQALRWGMSPFAAAQAVSVISGKLMFEGKLVAAVINANGNLQERLSYDYAGDGDNRAITVSGLLNGEKKPRTVDVKLKDAKTSNKVWQTQPDQQLMYHGVRVWARRHMPELMMGVYSPEEFEVVENNAPVIQAVATVVEANPALKTLTQEPPKQTVADYAKAYEIEIQLCDTEEKLDVVVKREAEKMSKLASVSPKWHSMIIAALDKQRASFEPVQEVLAEAAE